MFRNWNLCHLSVQEDVNALWPMLNGESGARNISAAFPAESLDEILGAALSLTVNPGLNSVGIDHGWGLLVVLQYK